MKRIFRSIVCSVVLFTLLPLQTQAAELLIPVGRIIGLQLQSDAVTVAAYDDALGENARSAGLKIGDQIISIDGNKIQTADDVRAALSRCGDQLELTVRRGTKLSKLHMTPEQTADGPRLGVYLRQGIAGIGTVTFYDPDTGTFGTLGHGVSDAKGSLLKMTKGSAYEASILSVRKGRCGEPGQLKGGSDTAVACGTLLRNTPQGVFGTTKQGWKGEPLPVAAFDEVRPGSATIRCQVSNAGVQEYDVEILKIYPKDRSDGRNFLIQITDPALLQITGGIVQGMSGSPVIQNGRIVGAVTHVCVFG